MDKQIQDTETKSFFSLREGSNYKVMMTYDREEVVEFEQFKRIVKQLNEPNVRFLTINERIVNANTIIDISPTESKTKLQIEELKKNPVEVLVDDGEGNAIELSKLLAKEGF